MSVRLPITQDGAHFSFTCELDGVTYYFEFRWNDRDSSWFMTVGDGEGTTIVAGVKVVINMPLLNFFTDDQLPLGSLIATDTGGTDLDAGFGDLGRRVIVTYLSPGEF